MSELSVAKAGHITWKKRAKALDALCICYRTGRRPPERLHQQLADSLQLIEDLKKLEESNASVP